MLDIKFIREIQKINPAAKVIVLSGGGEIISKDELYMMEVLQSVKAELKKPLDTQKLLRTVNKVLGEDEFLPN